MTKNVAVIGDNFMLPEVFRDVLRETVEYELDIRLHRNNWPGEGLHQGRMSEHPGAPREYFGDVDEVVEFIGDAEILITHIAPVSSTALDQLARLKMIAVSRGGPVNVDVGACHERGVLVVNTPGRNATAVAEFTIGAILTESRKIRVGHEALRQGTWRGDLYRADTTGKELSEMTVGVVGYGAIGRLVVRLLRAFGCKIFVFDPYARLTEDDVDYGVSKTDFDTLLASSDVVTLHTKVTEETKEMMNAEAFAKMREGAILVNTTRGILCDDQALVRALSKGKLGAAVLDTFTIEPLPRDSALMQLPNVTITPHIAGASVRTVSFAAEKIAEEVRRYITGEPPLNPC